MFLIKTIWDKIYFHPFFYLITVISFFTGHFRNLLYFSIIILVHELGHSLMGLILKCRLNRIEIYPFGGCSRLEYLVNIKLFYELLILLAGPITQLIFVSLIKHFNIDVESYFYTYSNFILLFNLLPIYPLDGGKIFNIILSYLISFYNSLKITYYFSYFVFSLLFFLSIKTNNLFIYIIIFSIIIELIKECKNLDNIYNKFLLERYINNIRFKKIKVISSVYKMKRDYYHIFKTNKYIEEKEYLNTYFS